jgi:citrate lyase subunit beta/citryl-CoA lyase
MGGKLCIHPGQVPVVARAFAPTAEEIERARQLLDSIGEERDGGAVARNGMMIDRPVLERARRVLREAGVA